MSSSGALSAALNGCCDRHVATLLCSPVQLVWRTSAGERLVAVAVQSPMRHVLAPLDAPTHYLTVHLKASPALSLF